MILPTETHPPSAAPLSLDLIRKYPGRRAGDLCEFLGLEKPPFKINVRKLKAMGLCERSLDERSA